MNVIAWSQNLQPEIATQAGAEAVCKEELFRRADIISLHLVLSERTRHVVGATELAQMKPTSYLVNTSRAGLVDESALIRALKAGDIAGAGLDVFEAEPLPADAPIRRAPRTLLTPHLGYVTEDNFRIYYDDALENVLAWLKGETLRGIE